MQLATRGANDSDTAFSQRTLAQLLGDMDQLEEAEELYRSCLKSARETHGDKHESTIITLSELAENLRIQGKLKEAEAMLREVEQGWCEAVGAQHRFSRHASARLADIQGEMQKRSRSIPGAQDMDAFSEMASSLSIHEGARYTINQMTLSSRVLHEHECIVAKRSKSQRETPNEGGRGRLLVM